MQRPCTGLPKTRSKLELELEPDMRMIQEGSHLEPAKEPKPAQCTVHDRPLVVEVVHVT